MELNGKTVLVTGGEGVGVGAGVCDAVAKAGGRLVINGLEADRVRAAAARYPGSLGIPADVRDAAAVEAMFRTIQERCGVIDCVVNNAGVGLSRHTHEASEQEVDSLYGVDLRGVWLVSRAFIRQLLAAGRPGSIVNVSSVHAHASIPLYTLYASAKAGIEGLTRGLAYEYGQHSIRCNAIAPGYVGAEQNRELIRSWSDDPEGWIRDHTLNHQALPCEITPLDCGNLAVFLLSDLSRCITGQTIRIDAGTTVMLYNRDFVEGGVST